MDDVSFIVILWYSKLLVADLAKRSLHMMPQDVAAPDAIVVPQLICDLILEHKKHILFWIDEPFNVVDSKIEECGFPLNE